MRTKGKPPRLRPRRWLREIFLMTQPPLLAVMQGGDYASVPIRSQQILKIIGGRVKRLFNSVWSGLLVSALLCEMVWAQATAQINGTVRDQSGAVLPGVELNATQT